MEMGSLLGLQIQPKIDCSQNRSRCKENESRQISGVEEGTQGFLRPLHHHDHEWVVTRGSLDVCVSFLG